MQQEVVKDVHFPEQEDFKFLLIKHKDISGIRYDDPEYKRIICSLDIYEEVNTTSKDFFDVMGEKMDLVKMQSRAFGLHTQVIRSTKNFIYELIHIDLAPKDTPLELYNGVANMLKTDHQHIFGNSLMIKTKINLDSNVTKMVDCTRNDLHDLLESRVRHIGVRIDDDGEMEEFTWYHEPEKFMDEFFVNDRKFVERAFLLHNLQIYYTPGSRDDLEKILNVKYDQVVIMTKITDTFYGDVKLEEVKDIIELLKSECPIECPEEWKKPSEELEKELKETRGKFMFNKYKALFKAKELYLQ